MDLGPDTKKTHKFWKHDLVEVCTLQVVSTLVYSSITFDRGIADNTCQSNMLTLDGVQTHDHTHVN